MKMRISGIFLGKSKKVGGYTLLEMLMVLFLISLMAGLAGPRLRKIYESIDHANQMDDVLMQIGRLGFLACKASQGFALTGRPPDKNDIHEAPLKLPPEWSITVVHPVRYTSDGICLGGGFYLKNGGRAVYVKLSPPLCVPEIVNDKDSLLQ